MCLLLYLPVSLSCTLDPGYVFQQVGALPWLGPSQGWSGSGPKILPVSQLFISVQHKFYPVKFGLLRALTKAGDTVQFF